MNEKRVARIIEEATGYFVSNDELPFADCRGRSHETRRAAISAARYADYTHYVTTAGLRKL